VQIINLRADLPFCHVKNSRLWYYLGSERILPRSKASSRKLKAAICLNEYSPNIEVETSTSGGVALNVGQNRCISHPPNTIDRCMFPLFSLLLRVNRANSIQSGS
jgi:hypothetical protein